MKLLYTVALFTSLISLTACDPKAIYWGGEGEHEYLKTARGENAVHCKTETRIEAPGIHFLEYYGLPREIEGNFICDSNDKPVLPKDCQGRAMRSTAELKAFWEKYQLPLGILHYECVNGVPRIPDRLLKRWRSEERLYPTCRNRQPCVK